MWDEGGVNRQRQDWLFETTFREYCEFVMVNHCFPTIAHDGQTRRLTSLASWKHAVKSNSPQKHRQRLLDFEHEQAKRINERKRFIDTVGIYWERGCPDNLEEYLDGNNRFVYFNPFTYMNIVREYNLDATICRYLGFFLKMLGYNDSVPWADFHYLINIDHFIDTGYLQAKTMELLCMLDLRERDLIVNKFGLSGAAPMSASELKSMFSVSGSRLYQVENKAFRKLRHISRNKKMINDFGRTKKSGAAIKPVSDDHFFILRRYNEQHVVRKRIEMLEEAVAEAGYQDYVIESSTTTFDDSSCYARCMLREYSSPHTSSFTYTLVELCDEPLPYEKSLAYWQKRREDYYRWISSPLYQYFYTESLASESPVRRYVVHSDI